LSLRYSKQSKVKSEEQKQKFIIKPIKKLLKRIYARPEGSVQFVKEETLKFCRVQELKRSYMEAFEELEREPDPEKSKEFIARKIRNLSALEQGGSEFFKIIEKLPEMLSRDKGRCATTGFKRLDRWMDGGMDPGTETVFIAPAKFGKSMALVNVGFANLLRGKTVVHFTLEISEKKIMKRYASRISRIRSIEKCPNKTIRRVSKFYQLHRGRLIVKGYPTKMATVETIKSYLYHLQNRDDIKPDVIIVDYGDLLRSGSYGKDRDGSSERFIQGDVFEGLRAMAQEFDCALVTASQCNRASATKPIIRMEDIAESYAKCQVADHIIALCGTEEERKKKRLRLFFAGSREAQTERSSRVKFNWFISSMKEVEDEPQEEKK
jgi:replicative DNA helicase